MKDYKLLHWLLNFVSHVKGKVLLAVIFGIVSNLSVVAIPLIGVHEVLMIIKERAG